jgi:hypothetical protein
LKDTADTKLLVAGPELGDAASCGDSWNRLVSELSGWIDWETLWSTQQKDHYRYHNILTLSTSAPMERDRG